MCNAAVWGADGVAIRTKSWGGIHWPKYCHWLPFQAAKGSLPLQLLLQECVPPVQVFWKLLASKRQPGTFPELLPSRESKKESFCHQPPAASTRQQLLYCALNVVLLCSSLHFSEPIWHLLSLWDKEQLETAYKLCSDPRNNSRGKGTSLSSCLTSQGC